jgi:hypothetical protein
MGVEDVDPNAGVGVEVLMAPVPPPQATSTVKDNAAHTCLISSPCSYRELHARSLYWPHYDRLLRFSPIVEMFF